MSMRTSEGLPYYERECWTVANIGGVYEYLFVGISAGRRRASSACCSCRFQRLTPISQLPCRAVSYPVARSTVAGNGAVSISSKPEAEGADGANLMEDDFIQHIQGRVTWIL